MPGLYQDKRASSHMYAFRDYLGGYIVIDLLDECPSLDKRPRVLEPPL